MDNIFSQAKSSTLRTTVTDMLRDAITSGKLKPGEHLKETELAEQMSVSRSPVREALRQLEQEDLIVAIPNQGCFVKTFSPKEIEEIFALRATLETLAFERIVERDKLTPNDWEIIEEFLHKQRAAIEAQAFDLLTKYDMDFHEFLCEKSGFDRLVKMWRSLRSQIQMLFFQRFRLLPNIPQTVDTDHEEFLDALRNGDINRLRDMNESINAGVAKDCIAVFQREQETLE